jgi:hypothetical protein
MTHSLDIYIGVDPKESVAFHVLVSSIIRHTSFPVRIFPLVQDVLREQKLYSRERLPTESTTFSFSRFLVPALSGYSGLSLYLDCDMVAVEDLSDLVIASFTQPDKAVLVCQHDYTPRDTQKMGGLVQKNYPRKNWSSFILYRNDRCRMLTPAYVNTASPADLHQFAWLPDEQIGSLPLAWNVLIGEDNQTTAPPKVLHYTNGGPWLQEYRDCDYSDLWWQEYREMLHPCQG